MNYVAIRTLLAVCALLFLGTAATTHAMLPVDVTILPSDGNAVAVDAAGNLYVTGQVDAQSLPGAHRPVANASVDADVYVAKLDPTGRLLFQTVFGGRYYDEGLSIGVDAQGRIYVVGVTYSADFADPNFDNYPAPGEIIWPSPDFIHYGGGFLAVLDPTGSAVLYSEILSENEEGVWVTDVAVTPDGRAYYLSMSSSYFLPGFGAFKADGGRVPDPQLWMGCGAWYYSYLTGLATDPAGNLYVSGTEYVEADTTEYWLIGRAYVEKLDPRGAHLYTTCFGSMDNVMGNDVAADPAGNSYLTGYAANGALPVAGALQPEPGGGGDAFIAKLGPTGEVVYATYLGGSGLDEGVGIAADPSGAVHVTGVTYSSDFPKARPLSDGCVSRPGSPCRFVARLGPTGEKLDFATLFGRPWLMTSTESGGEPVAAGPRGETYLVDGSPVFRFAANRPPDCAAAVVSPAVIWPPDGRMAPVAITGVTDPEGGEVELSVTAIFQDEPSTPGTADATGIGTPNVSLRAARSGSGDGRVYHLRFTVADELGLACTGEVTVCVPHNQGRGRTCGDGGALFASGPGGAER